MRLTCPSCSSVYEIAAGAIGKRGRMVRCARCEAEWFQAPGRDDPHQAARAEPSALEHPMRAAPVVTPLRAETPPLENVYYDVEPDRQGTGAVYGGSPISPSAVVVDETRVRITRSTQQVDELAASLREEDDYVEPRRSGAFLAGFATVTLIALILIAIYIKAPDIVEIAPSARGPLEAYSQWVDQGRVMLAETAGGR